MYQIKAWRYWLVGLVVTAGLLLALPNLFGEDAALQLTREDRGAMDAANEKKIEDILKAQKLAVTAKYFEDGRLVLRFAQVDEQIQARDAIQDATVGEYIVALTSVPRTPELLRKIGLKPMSLGLDLRGGVHFMYEVDLQAAVEQALQRLAQDIRAQLRSERIQYSDIDIGKDVIRVTLREGADAAAAEKAIKGDDTGIVVTTNVSGPAPVLTVSLTPEQIKQHQDLAIEQNITTLRNRVNELGVSEPIVARQGLDRIIVQLPGVQDPNQAIRVLGSTATIEFRMEYTNGNAYDAQSTGRAPLGSKLYKTRDGQPVLLKRDVIAAGEQLAHATSAFGQEGPEVNVRLDARGGANMLKNTQQNLGRRMGVAYIEKKRLAEGEVCQGTRVAHDCTEEKVISLATIQGVFSTNFRITGLEASEAQELALLLRSGTLSVPSYIIEQRTVGPSLGKDNIERGFKALGVGALLTFVFMAMYYRAFGLVANVVLICNVMLLIAVMSLLQAALSLPGIAGIVLTIGMAADANVLIYERIREELRLGNSPQASIHAGFEKAFSAIADSNITTLIAGIVLFVFGTGPIKGFAITLIIGIGTSLFTAILGGHVLLDLIWGRRRHLKSLPV